jgi:hypothetical protein
VVEFRIGDAPWAPPADRRSAFRELRQRLKEWPEACRAPTLRVDEALQPLIKEVVKQHRNQSSAPLRPNR